MALGQDEIAAKVKEAREAAALTQQELGDRIGITSQQISRYERGANSVPMKQLRRIAEETRQPLSYFVAEEDEHLTPGDDLRRLLREELATVRREVAGDLAATVEGFLDRLPQEIARALAESRPEHAHRR